MSTTIQHTAWHPNVARAGERAELVVLLLLTACLCVRVFAAQEAAVCRAIAARGVLLVSTAHGSSLSDQLANPELSGLVGGVKAVTLGDRTAVASNGGHKACGTA